MIYNIIGTIILAASLVILSIVMYYVIKKASETLIPDDSRENEMLYDGISYINNPDTSKENLLSSETGHEVKNAEGKVRRHKNSGMYFFFSKQPEGNKKRGKIRTGKQSSVHGLVR